MTSITESSSYYDHLEKMSVADLLMNINREDKTVPEAVAKAIPAIARLVDAVVGRMASGGRLFYIGAGTSGRLGIVDASEIPPTYGMPHGRVIGIMAGGDSAIRKSVEHAEDDEHQAWKDLQDFNISSNDVLIGIAASGRTPYVAGGLRAARENGIVTGCITCNRDSLVAKHADHPVEVVVGPEFVTGSTRMKSGTAQKGNKMVDMQLSNNKLIDRGTRMIMNELGVDELEAAKLLKQYGSVRLAVDSRLGHARH
jgi:N-acetylmuramic acid 6-phosphate etherase